MAEPAYGGAADPGPPAARRPDPRASGWAAAQRATAAGAELNALAVRQALARPGDADALEIARLSIAVLQEMSETFRRLTTEDAVMAEERAAGYREGWAACKADRCRLGVIPGGRGIPGPH